MDTYKMLKIGGIVCSILGSAATVAGSMIGEKKASIDMAKEVSKEVARQLGK